MKFLLGGVLLSCMAAVAAQATTVTETITGRIAGFPTVDTNGYFGPAGTDLKGAKVTLVARYVTQDFNSSTQCLHYGCTVYSSTNLPKTPQSVFIKVTVKGVTVTFKPVAVGDVTVFNGSNFIEMKSDAGSVPNTGMFMGLWLQAPATFGGPLTPRLQYAQQFFTFLPNTGAAEEPLSFTAITATP